MRWFYILEDCVLSSLIEFIFFCLFSSQWTPWNNFGEKTPSSYNFIVDNFHNSMHESNVYKKQMTVEQYELEAMSI